MLLSAEAPEIASSIWTTRCSKTKPVKAGVPEQLYRSASNEFFYRFVRRNNFRFGIISDKYGIHMDIERLRYYDVHPGQLSRDAKELLGQLVKKKVEAAGFERIVFYNASPLMSTPYFEILSYCELPVYYTTRLFDLETPNSET